MIFGWLARYRHSKGFGVHSPFAFRFIKETLTERAPYYDYERIPSKANRLIYRIAATLQPDSVITLGSADASAASLACPTLPAKRLTPRWVGVDVRQLCVAAPDADAQQLCDALNRGAAVVLSYRDGELLRRAEQALDAMGHGIVFDNAKGTAVMTPFSTLPRQKFTVRF